MSTPPPEVFPSAKESPPAVETHAGCFLWPPHAPILTQTWMEKDDLACVLVRAFLLCRPQGRPALGATQSCFQKAVLVWAVCCRHGPPQGTWFLPLPGLWIEGGDALLGRTHKPGPLCASSSGSGVRWWEVPRGSGFRAGRDALVWRTRAVQRGSLGGQRAGGPRRSRRA